MELPLPVGDWLHTRDRGWQHQGYPEGAGNIRAAETSTMTFKEQLWLNEAGEQIPAPSSQQRQESQQGTDRFIMFLGVAPLHFAGDKVTPLQPEHRDGLGWLFRETGTRSCSQTPGICCQHGAPWVTGADVQLASARATSTSFQQHSQGPGHGTGASAASWLPPGKEGCKTRINTAFKVTPTPHPLLHSLVKAFTEEICQLESSEGGDASKGV